MWNGSRLWILFDRGGATPKPGGLDGAAVFGFAVASTLLI